MAIIQLVLICIFHYLLKSKLKLSTKDLRYVYNFFRKRMLHVNIQLLYDCNFRCKICDFWKESYSNSPRINLDSIKIISKKLEHFGPLMVSIGGGEPLLHNQIFEISETFAQKHYPIMICNGWYINKDNAKKLFKAGLHEISISVDYANSQKHDEQRGVEGAFNRAINALKILNESRVSANQRVHMISVVMDDNIDEIEELILLAKKIGVTYLVTLYSDSRGKKEDKLSVNDVSSKLLELKQKYKEFVAIPSYLARFTEAIESDYGISPCTAGINLFNIDSSGNVSLCIDKLDESAGNIIFDNIEIIERNLIELNKSNNCRSCWTSCRGVFQSLLYGDNKLKNYLALYNTIKDVPLTKD